MAVIDIPAVPVHPGEILEEEFLRPLALSQTDLAKHIGVSVRRVNEICRVRRAITTETAWLLACAFGTTPKFWLNGQAIYELALARQQDRLRDVGLIVAKVG